MVTGFRVLLVVGLVAGCDSLAADDYVGEPLFTLQGTFATTANAPDDPLGGVALLWQDTRSADGPGVATTVVPVAIQFPASFRVDIPVPPPDAAKFTFPDTAVQIAEAYVFVVETSGAKITPRGGERVHAVVWASADVAEGTQAADYLGGAIAAGYHLRTFTPVTTAGTGQRTLIERCVSVGGARHACEARRAYQLANASDRDRLAITVAPP